METPKGAIYTSMRKVYKDILSYENREINNISSKITRELKRQNFSKMEFASLCGINRDTVIRYTDKRLHESQMNVKILKQMEDVLKIERFSLCNDYHQFIDLTDGGAWIKEKRKFLGMTQREFAKMLNIPLQRYKAYEAGYVKVPYEVWKGSSS